MRRIVDPDHRNSRDRPLVTSVGTEIDDEDAADTDCLDVADDDGDVVDDEIDVLLDANDLAHS